jgi:hypothetical protein
MKGMEKLYLHTAWGVPGHEWRVAAVGCTFSLHKTALTLGCFFKVKRLL